MIITFWKFTDVLRLQKHHEHWCVCKYNLLCKPRFVTWLQDPLHGWQCHCVRWLLLWWLVDYGSSACQHPQSTSTTKGMRKRDVYLGLDVVNYSVQIRAPCLISKLGFDFSFWLSFSFSVSFLLCYLGLSPSATIRQKCLWAKLELMTWATLSPVSVTWCIFLQPPVSVPESNWPTLNISCSPTRQPPPFSLAWLNPVCQSAVLFCALHAPVRCRLVTGYLGFTHYCCACLFICSLSWQ